MNEVGAKEKGKSKKGEIPIVDIDIHVGVFFDGTNNNANTNTWTDWLKIKSIVERNHAYTNTIKYSEAQKRGEEQEKEEKDIVYRKNSNPAILSKLFYTKPRDNSEQGKTKFLHVYIEGSGSNGFQAENKVVDFVVNGKAIKGLGFGVGPTGVVAKVSKAVKYVAQRIEKEENNNLTNINHIYFYVFGFSRGSACARLFSFLIARSAGDAVGILKKDVKGLIKKNAEAEFNKYLTGKYFKKGKVCFLENYKNKMTVDFLGIYDTVAAIGFLQEENGEVNGLRTAFMTDSDFWDNFHRENATCYGLYSPNLEHVKSTCHICALDEFRANFALTDIGSAANKEGNIELLLPGCHSDIGGGYTDREEEKVEHKTLLKNFDGKKTRMCVNHPTNSASSEKNAISNDDWKNLSVEMLKELGWIDDEMKDLVSQKEDNGIELQHYPKPRNPYSNIPLKFMYERAIKKTEIALFDIYPEFYYPIPKEPDGEILKEMWEKIARLETASGRYVYLINGSYNSDDYKKVRQNYLHFTSTDTMHGAGDIGNSPGRRTVNNFSDICRLVYHGDKDDTKVYYMQDYGIDAW